jgi:hypothetical protein
MASLAREPKVRVGDGKTGGHAESAREFRALPDAD